jgi:hypothetical protein
MGTGEQQPRRAVKAAGPRNRGPKLLVPHLLSRRLTLDGHLAARSIYGAIVVLALLLTMQGHPPAPFTAALTVGGSVVAVLAAEVYAELLGMEMDARRPTTREERVDKLHELGTITAAAEVPVVVLLLSGFGLFGIDVAITLAMWLTVAIIVGAGYLARRWSGQSVPAALRSAAALGAIGIALAVFKQLPH